jgi:phosphoenolpyruvate-protein kinase (PTS system EI component)
MLYEHDLEVRDKYRADREAYLQDIKKEVLKNIQGELGQVGELTEQYKVLVLSAKDVLREKIMQIYFKGKAEK